MSEPKDIKSDSGELRYPLPREKIASTRGCITFTKQSPSGMQSRTCLC